MSEQFFHILTISSISVITLFFVIWVIHLLLKNAAIVDVGWGIGFVLLTGVYIVMGEGWTLRNSILFLMVAAWGLRIAFFLIKRLSEEKEEDRRYKKFREEWGSNISLKFLLFFEFQAFLEIILALPFIFVALNPEPGLSWIEILGLILFSIALIGESIADEQLFKFKSNPENKRKTCDIGLWKYSRHPNYFFEWLIWVGLAIYSMSTPLGWFAPLSPLIIYFIVRHGSGVPLAEKMSLESRGESYREYQKKTSIFFPLPPKENEVFSS